MGIGAEPVTIASWSAIEDRRHRLKTLDGDGNRPRGAVRSELPSGRKAARANTQGEDLAAYCSRVYPRGRILHVPRNKKIERAIARYRRLRELNSDALARQAAEELAAELEAKKTALHPTHH